MTDKQMQKFLASVRRTRFVDYLDPLGETAQKALERRLQWARVSQGDPASTDEAKFLLENADDLREVLRRELDEDDWVEDTSAGREFDATARKAPKVRENARVTEMFQSDDLRSGSVDLGVTPKRPSGAAFARPQLAVRTPVPASDRERKVSVRVGGASAYVEEEDEEDPDEMPTGIMRIEDVTNPSLKTAIREASPRPTQTRAAKAPSAPPPAAKAKPPPASLKVGVGRRAPVEEDDDDAPSADPAWGRGGRTTPPPPPPTPIPAPLRSAKLSTPPPSIARSRTAPPAGTGAKVVLGTSPPAVPRIRPSEGQLGAPARRGSPPNRLLLFALLGVAAVAIVLVFALPALVSFGRGDRVVVAEPVETPAPVVLPAPVAPPVEIPAPPEPVVAVAEPAPAPAPVTAPAPRPVAAPAPAPEPVASTPKPEPAPVAAPAPAPAPVPAPVVAAAVVPEVPAEPVEAAPAPPAFPLKGTWASSTLKLTVRNQAGTSFDGTAEVRQDDGSWTSIPVKGSVDGTGSLAFEGGAMSFGGTAKGGVAKGNVIRGEGKDAEPVQLVRF